MAKLAGTASRRISSLQRALETRVANPVFTRLLRSQLHRPASRWLVLVSYIGPQSGRRYTFPVAYARVDDAVVVLTSKEESRWWRNFRRSRECYVWVDGDVYPATGVVATGDERGRLMAGYLERHGLFGRLLGADTADLSAPDRLARENPDLVVVRFTVDERPWDLPRLVTVPRPESSSVPVP